MYLLDTHALLWWLEAPHRLSAAALDAIRKEENLIYVSAATVWEIAIKSAAGKLRIPTNLVERITANRFVELPIRSTHALRAGHLPPLHHDPFDRILIAQSVEERLTLITQDANIVRYDVPILLTTP